jgi:hypothetical protein
MQTSCIIPAGTDINGVDPLLGPLANNGGDTLDPRFTLWESCY